MTILNSAKIQTWRSYFKFLDGSLRDDERLIKDLIRAVEVMSLGLEEIRKNGDVYYVRDSNPAKLGRIPRYVSDDIIKQIWGPNETRIGNTERHTGSPEVPS